MAGDLIPAARKRFQPPQLVLAQSLGYDCAAESLPAPLRLTHGSTELLAVCSQSQSLNLEQALGGQPEGHDQKQRILSSLKCV